MIRKRNLSTKLLLLLRNAGMLCKAPVEYKPELKISKTVYPENYVNALDSERHVWIQNKKSSIKNCEFNIETGTCSKCNITTEQFAIGQCLNRKIK